MFIFSSVAHSCGYCMFVFFFSCVGILVNSCLVCSGCFSLFMYISLIMLIVYYTETAVWDANNLTIQLEVPKCATERGHGTGADTEPRLTEELF